MCEGLKDNGSEPVRILHVIGAMNRGGAETMIMNLYRKIDRDKIQFDFLLSSNNHGQYEDEIRTLGGKIYHIQHFNGLNVITYYKQCISFFKKHPEISIVHGHIGSSAAFYLQAAKTYGCFTIAHSHNANASFCMHSIGYKFFSFPTRYIADQLFGCSTEAGIARYGKWVTETRKYRNFNNGINLNDFYFDKDIRKQVREEFHIGEKDIVIGTVGRITEQKNPSMIFSIFQKAAASNSNCYCLWIGTGQEEEKFRKMIIEEKLSDKILMLGVRNDIPRLLQAFDCFLFPSFWEGLPVTLIEAQAAGVPCVISESITCEVEITGLIERHSLDENAEEWVTACFSNAKRYRDNRSCFKEAVKSSGYDIGETSKWLYDFYLAHSHK